MNRNGNVDLAVKLTRKKKKKKRKAPIKLYKHRVHVYYRGERLYGGGESVSNVLKFSTINDTLYNIIIS